MMRQWQQVYWVCLVFLVCLNLLGMYDAWRSTRTKGINKPVQNIQTLSLQEETMRNEKSKSMNDVISQLTKAIVSHNSSGNLKRGTVVDSWSLYDDYNRYSSVKQLTDKNHIYEHNSPSKALGHKHTPRPPLPQVQKNETAIKIRLKNSPVKNHNTVFLVKPSHGVFLTSLVANLSTHSHQDQTYLRDRVAVYLERARHVSDVCLRHQSTLIKPTILRTLVWDRKHNPNLIWCEISKVASSTWMVNFLRLAHYRENDPSLANLNSSERYQAIYGDDKMADVSTRKEVYQLYPFPKTPSQQRKLLNSSLRFIIVRHPFTRLLSAYVDKMTVDTPKPVTFNFRQLQRDIISRYRREEDPDSPYPTFSEFIQYVLESTENFTTIKHWKKSLCWKPYWVSCHVCSMDYQLVMKLETMQEDERFLITLAGLTELKQQVHEWRNNKSSQNSTNKSTYFRQLSTKQMYQLYDLYRLDFELFDYNLDQYLPLAHDVQLSK
ncbi:hypothetical protein Pcinc_017137 [Petrolisthes cinctipes]|uniref:Carbohydrate sulfotransferase n=1 Tax=Petrolisthes cinctipes TaxID=88211 RepID=A0AAE1KN37_PETCI|nr:hypothetical protein Pcinc_017137 [Petrolisthes cinctipes]